MNEIDRCEHCGKLAFLGDVITITVLEYQALKIAGETATTRKSISSYRAASRSKIARKPELANFILDCAVTMTVAETKAACDKNFGTGAPSRSSIFRFIRQMKSYR